VGFHAACDDHVGKAERDLPRCVVDRGDTGTALHFYLMPLGVQGETGAQRNVSDGIIGFLVTESGTGKDGIDAVWTGFFQNGTFFNQTFYTLNSQFCTGEPTQRAAAVGERGARKIDKYYFSQMIDLPLKIGIKSAVLAGC
jgi:hypothetical protein